MKKKENEVYELTPKGFLKDKVYDQLILYMIRTGYNGIVCDNAKLEFVKLGKMEG